MGTWKPGKLTAKWSQEVGFSFDTTLGNNFLIKQYEVLNQDNDFVILIDGYEGSSKSHAAQQLAYFLDIDEKTDSGLIDPTTKKKLYDPAGRKVTIQNITYDLKELKEKVLNLPEGKAIIADEAQKFTDRREFGSDVVKEFNNFMRECRKYNKFIILIVQRFYDCDFFLATGRAHCLIHMKTSYKKEKDPVSIRSPLIRGNARFYDQTGMERLYANELWRKTYKYPYIEGHCFDFKMPYKWIIPKEEYDQWKEAKIREREKTFNYKNLKCPSCFGGKLRYNRTKKLWQCGYCPWAGPPSALGIIQELPRKGIEK